MFNRTASLIVLVMVVGRLPATHYALNQFVCESAFGNTKLICSPRRRQVACFGYPDEMQIAHIITGIDRKINHTKWDSRSHRPSAGKEIPERGWLVAAIYQHIQSV